MAQIESGSEYTPLEGVQAYAFAADSVEWRPTSYEQALKGEVSNKAGKTLSPIASSLPYEDSRSWVSMTIDAENVLIVAVDTENQCYAYTNYTVGVNLKQTYVSMVFRPWKDTPVYKDGSWFYYPTIVEKPTEDDATVTE